MFFVLSKLLDVFLSPYTWGLLALALAVPWRGPTSARRSRRQRRFGIAGMVLLLGFGTPQVSNRLLYRLEHSHTPTYRPDVVYDVVILLGGISDERVLAETGQPSYNDNVDRLTATHRVLATGRARTAISSGAASDTSLVQFGEARVLARQIADWGVDPKRILLEEQARNTYENALYSKKIVAEHGFQKVLIVTSAFHMRRAAECFEAVGLKVDTLSVDYRAGARTDSIFPRAGNLSESTMALHEMAGLYIYRLRGYAKPTEH